MNIKRRLTQKCVLERYIDNSEYSIQGEYSEPVEISCFSEGGIKTEVIDGHISIITFKKIWVTDHVKIKDKINGCVVSEVNEIPYLDGSIALFECILK